MSVESFSVPSFVGVLLGEDISLFVGEAGLLSDSSPKTEIQIGFNHNYDCISGTFKYLL